MKLVNKGTGSFFLLGAIVAAAVAGFLAIQAVRMAAPTVPVLVAKTDLKVGERLTEDKIEVINLPPAAVPKDRVNADNFDKTVGYHLKTALAAGTPIQTSYIAELSPAGGTLAARLALTGQGNWRAIALPPDATKGLPVEVGDRVDIIGVTGEGPAAVTEVLAEGVMVVEAPPAPKDDSEPGSAVVAVPLEKAPKVVLAITKGKVLAALRPVE
ncbi:MAG: Flp pilus assembly protein CpaB [Moorella sp. (in: firmicutes)]